MNNPPQRPSWYRRLLEYRSSSWRSGWIQIINSVLPFLAIYGGMCMLISRGTNFWLVLPLAIPASFFQVRSFIIFHDCCHDSFFPSRRANRIVGHLTGVMTLTPFEQWRFGHLTHHATNSQLDHRGVGDVYTMTFEEYRREKWLGKFRYRLARNPFVLFVLGPLWIFILESRLPRQNSTPKIRWSVRLTNLLLIAYAAGWSLLFGIRAFVLVQLSVIWIAGAMGIWLFYIQHQFDPGYWARDEEWDSIDAALSGSSHYRLPKILQWLTGNIGLHHVHHLQPGIPNYQLEQALEVIPKKRRDQSITIRDSLRSLTINLWHESERRFLSFREAHRLIRTEYQ